MQPIPKPTSLFGKCQQFVDTPWWFFATIVCLMYILSYCHTSKTHKHTTIAIINCFHQLGNITNKSLQHACILNKFIVINAVQNQTQTDLNNNRNENLALDCTSDMISSTNRATLVSRVYHPTKMIFKIWFHKYRHHLIAYKLFAKIARDDRFAFISCGPY